MCTFFAFNQLLYPSFYRRPSFFVCHSLQGRLRKCFSCHRVAIHLRFVQCIGQKRIYPRHDLPWTTMAARKPFFLNRTFISDRICPHSINITFCENLFFNFVCRMSYFLLLFYLLKQERNPGMDLYAKNKMEKRSSDPGNCLIKLQVTFFQDEKFNEKQIRRTNYY